MAYDTNVIIQFLSGNGNHVITGGTQRMQKKLGIPAQQVVTVEAFGPRPFSMSAATRQELTVALAVLTGQSRLYLRGHGDWKHTTLGGWTPGEVAGALLLGGLAVTPALISVTGCQCARAVSPGAEGKSLSTFPERSAAEMVLLARSTHSFAGLLHGRLCQRGITSPLFGRVYSVSVVDDGDDEHLAGQKVTATPGGDTRRHRRRSKVRFDWVGGQSVQQWVD